MVIVYEPSVSICVGPRRSPAALCVGPRRCVCPLCRTPALSVSGPGVLCVGARRSARRGPTLCVGPGGLCVGPAALCWGLGVCVSGPSALCGGRHSLCRALALSLSGRRSRRSLCRALLCRPFCVGPRRSLAVRLGPGALCVRARRSFALCVGMCVPSRTLLPLSVSDLGALHRSLCRARRSPAVSLCRVPALCRGLRRGPRSSPDTFFMSGPGGLCVEALCVLAGRCLSRGPALCVGPGALCRGPALCVVAPRSLGRGPALLVSGPALCRGRRRGLGALPTFSVYRAPALFVRAGRSLGPAVRVSRPNDLCVRGQAQRCVFGAQRPQLRAPNPSFIWLQIVPTLMRPPSKHRGPSSDPSATISGT